MPFYGPLCETAWQTTTDWLWAWAVFPGAILGIMGPAACILLFEFILSRERKVSAVTWRICRIAVEAAIGATATVGVMFIISLFFYAPRVLLQNTAATAAKQATQHQAKIDATSYAVEMDKLTQQLNQLHAQLNTQPIAYIGFPKTILKKSTARISVTATLHNYGAVSAENVGTVGSVVFGDGSNSQMLSATLSPPVRLLPGEEHHLEMFVELSKGVRVGSEFDKYATLVEHQQPIVLTINLYFSSNGIQYSQHTVLSYDYKEKFWHTAAEQSLQGFVAMPAAIYKGAPQYWTAPWLPPIPSTVAADAVYHSINASPVF